MTPTPEYSPQQKMAAMTIASLIHPAWPAGPDLDPPVYNGIWGDAVKAVQAPYHLAVELMQQTGQQYDSPADAALAWELLRNNSTTDAPYAAIEPLIRTLMAQADSAPPVPRREHAFVAPESTKALAKPKTEYEVWAPDIISAASLYHKQFSNLVWTVDGIIPEGVCVLAGKPKSKKSWLALGIAVGVAYGGRAFSYYDVTPGRVLYLDLESNQRRMRSRLQAIIGDRVAWPNNFDIVTKWKRGDEGIVLLDGYCEAHPDTRLCVIDIWARFRAMKDPKADAYDQDYNALQALNEWAERRRVTVIVIHHTRKAKSDDVFEEISGTNGIVGAVATAMILSRSPDVPDEQLLHMTGRDLIVDEPIALKWDAYTCQHIYVATGAEASSSGERRRLLATMEDDQEYGVKDLASAVGKSVKAIDNHLRRLMDDQLIQRTGRGRYAKIPQQATELKNGVENVENVESMESVENVDSLVVNFPHDDLGRGKRRGKGLAHQDASNGSFHVFHGDSHIHAIFAHVPPERLSNLRSYLLSNIEKDQEEAQRLCRLFDLDYTEARKAVQ